MIGNNKSNRSTGPIGIPKEPIEIPKEPIEIPNRFFRNSNRSTGPIGIPKEPNEIPKEFFRNFIWFLKNRLGIPIGFKRNPEEEKVRAWPIFRREAGPGPGTHRACGHFVQNARANYMGYLFLY